MDVDLDLFVARTGVPGCTFTYTLTTRLGHILRSAEERFGPRDKDYTILGIEFVDGIPQIWYPSNCKHIAIQLGIECMNDNSQACFQLAHEAIHLLSPTGEPKNATVLEEGLAALFSREYSKTVFPNDWKKPSSLNYQDALEKVEFLTALYPSVIRTLREKEPTMLRITADLIKEMYPDIDPDFAAALTLPFPYEDKA